MKKMVILVFALLMVLGTASATMAATIYFDTMVGGELDDGFESFDLSQITVGFDHLTKDFKFSGTITSGTYDDSVEDMDTASILLKGGVAVVNDRQFRLDLIAGIYNRDTDLYHGDVGYTTDSYSSLMLGFDARLKLDKRAWIDFSYAFGVAPQVEVDDGDYIESYDMDSLTLLNCKFNLLLNRKFGVALGYSSETMDYEGSAKDTYSGITLGGFVKF